MDIEEFCRKRPYLYHLTDSRNSQTIINKRRILSTAEIARLCLPLDEASDYLRTKRSDHTVLKVDGMEFRIRDQKPISTLVLGRSLTPGWTTPQFIEHLNARVFMWPTINRLKRHFDRYVSEAPIILRVRSEDILNIHPDAEFCRLNSGATRCSSHYGGNAPTRGDGTFVMASEFRTGPADVAEVTFMGSCRLPDRLWISSDPDGPWNEI